MSACEKCWSDAYVLAMNRGGHQADHYAALLIERRDNPCTPRQQAGEWWDPQTKRDMRELGHSRLPMENDLKRAWREKQEGFAAAADMIRSLVNEWTALNVRYEAMEEALRKRIEAGRSAPTAPVLGLGRTEPKP